MKYILAILALLTFATPLHAVDKTCVAGAKSDFIQYTMREKFQVMVLHPEDLQKLLNFINAKREALKMYPFEADELILAFLPTKDSGPAKVGVVMFKDGCVVPGTMLVFATAEFIKLLVDAGIPEPRLSKLVNA